MSEGYKEYNMAKIKEDRKKAIESDLPGEREKNEKENMRHRVQYKANKIIEQITSSHATSISLEDLKLIEKAADEVLYLIAPGSRPETEKED